MGKRTESAVASKHVARRRSGCSSIVPLRSCVRIGAVSTFSTIPVPACISARKCATGNPHPGFCAGGWPNSFCRAGLSGMEKLDPST